MSDTPLLEDAEAIRMLWDNTLVFDTQANQLAGLTGRLIHTVRRFAQGVVDDQPEDPRELLTELGAALETGIALERTQAGLAEALSSLSFAWSPRPPESEPVQLAALRSLRERLRARSRARWRPNPP